MAEVDEKDALTETEAEPQTVQPSWPLAPCLVGTSGDAFYAPVTPLSASCGSTETNNFFKSCQWSPDGTTLLTSGADNVLRTFILPPDLLSTSEPTSLQPYHSHQLPSPCYATAVHPSYTLSDPSTALYLASAADLPIRLISPFSTTSIASYSFINANTEAFTAPHSLLFDSTPSSSGAHFFAGTDSLVGIFDLHRPGSGPHTLLATIPSKRKKLVGGGVGFKGIVSTLACSADGLLAAGSFTRWIGLYDGRGRGDVVGVFKLRGHDGDAGDADSDGAGVTQVAWTEDGKYLLVAERKSEGIGVWDVRTTGRRLAWLQGRCCDTMQRMGIGVAGDAVLAGGVDGKVRAWMGVGADEGSVDPSWEFQAHEVASAVMHPTAAVMATCSGQRHEPEAADGADSESATDSEGSSDGEDGGDDCDETGKPRNPKTWDNSVRVWSLYEQSNKR